MLYGSDSQRVVHGVVVERNDFATLVDSEVHAGVRSRGDELHNILFALEVVCHLFKLHRCSLELTILVAELHMCIFASGLTAEGNQDWLAANGLLRRQRECLEGDNRPLTEGKKSQRCH